MPTRTSTSGSELFIVDNSNEDWKVVRYLHDWCQISKSIPGIAENIELNVQITGRHVNAIQERFEEHRDAPKAATARTLWIPAVSNHGGFGRWGFLEVDDPWDAKGVVRSFLLKGMPS